MGSNSIGAYRALPPNTSSQGTNEPDEQVNPSAVASTQDTDVRHTPDNPGRSVDRGLAKEKLRSLALHTVYSDAFITVQSDDKLTRAQGKALADKITKAYDYDTSTEQWKNTTPLKAKLTVDALSKSGFDQILGGDSTGIAGVTMNANLMAVPDNLISTATPDDDDTLAHEANHVQDFREAGNNIDKVPRYVQEGKAYCQGDLYPKFLGEDGKDVVLPQLAKALGTFTGADAQDVVDHYRTGQDSANAGPNGFRDEIMGALFVQWLQADLGVKDAIPKMAQVVADVGTGKTWNAAFKAQFGITPKQAETQYVAFVKKTEGDPAERLKGTLWEPYLQ